MMVKPHGSNCRIITVMILSFRTQRSSLFRVYTVCHSVCIVWTHYSLVEPHSSNFRVITTNFLGVRIFRKFTVQQFFQCPNFCIFTLPQFAFLTGLHLKKTLKWMTEAQQEKATKIVSKRVDEFRERTQEQLGQVHDP